MDMYKDKIPHLDTILFLAKKHNTNVWAVGGCLRDIYLKCKKELKDFDFCVERNIHRLVKEFADHFDSKVIILDDIQNSMRVIVKGDSKNYCFDFTAIRGASLADDLALRDFTVNSLALDIAGADQLIDCCDSIKDLKAGRLRAPSSRVFRDDPLRILRGFAFMANYAFKLEAKTLKVMVASRKLLTKVSGERLGEEFLKIFRSSDSRMAIKLMDKTRVLDELLPCIAAARGVTQEGGYHHLDVWGHSLEALSCFERLKKKLTSHKKCIEYIDEVLSQGRTREQLIKLSCLLHDVGKPKAKAKKNKRTIFYAHEKIGRDMSVPIIKRLRLSTREGNFIKNLIFWHLRPGYLADQKEPTRRAVYRFFRDTGEDGVAVVLLSLADWHATRGPLIDMRARAMHEKVMLRLIDEYFEVRDQKPIPKLIDGYDIMRQFKLKPSPLIGKVLKDIHEAQALKKISTREEAFILAEKVITKQRK